MARKDTKKAIAADPAKSDEAGLKKQQQIGEIVARHRAALNDELKRIDPKLVMELAVCPAIDQIPDFGALFSDWPDTWTDHGQWYKTWGKSGDEDMLPLETLRERMQLARLKGLLEKSAKKSSE